MEAVLHIGMPKTGTSALQNALMANHATLLAQGVLYPQSPDRAFSNHRMLLADAAPLDKLPRHIQRDYDGSEASQVKAEFISATARVIAQHNPKAIALSAESFFRTFADDGWNHLYESFAALGAKSGQTRVVAYVRRPSDRFLSGLQQHLKASYKIPTPNPPSYRRILERYLNSFGADFMHVLPFSRSALIGADITTDFVTRFLAQYGVDKDSLQPVGDLNVSVSAEGADIQRAYRARFHRDRDNRHTPDSERLFTTLKRIDKEVGATRPRLADGIAEMVDYLSTDPLWMRDQFGVTFSDFDYARLEKGKLSTRPDTGWTLDKVMQIDRSVQQAILDKLTQSPWCAADDERARWVAQLQSDLGKSSGKPSAAAAQPTKSFPPPNRKVTPMENTETKKKKKKDAGAAPPEFDDKLVSDIARAVWKAEQHAQNPAITPEEMKAGWSEARAEAKRSTRRILRAMKRAGYRIEPVATDEG